jgi:hypothetical protein
MRLAVGGIGFLDYRFNVTNRETCIVQDLLKSFQAVAQFLLFALMCLVGASSAGSARESTLYTVSNVEVDVTAKDASTAKLKAISEAQVKAFRVLAERLGGPEAVTAVEYLDAADIGRMMSSLSIQSEKSGPGRYIGKLSVAFLPDKVRQAFAQFGVSYSEERAPRIVILPVWNGPEGPVAWEDNAWRKAWLSLNTENDLVPVMVPLGDLDDSEIITAEQALRGDAVRLESLKLRYEAEAVLVAIAEPQGETAIRAVMSGASPLGTVAFDKVFDGAEGGLDAAAAMAAQRFVALLNEKWKVASAGTPQQAAPIQTVAVTVPFRSLGQWNAIRAQLLSVQGVAQIDVTTIASGGARIRLGFTSDFGELKQSLAVVGMKLVDIKGAWVLQPL